MYTSSITVDQVIDALVVFLTPFMPGGATQIVRAQVNRVALPSNPCCVLTELFQFDLTIPHSDYSPVDGSATLDGHKRIDVQIDFYGAQAGEFCAAAIMAFRTQWGYDQFPASIKPLYTSEGIQSPLTTGEDQYESRWTMTAFMQYNPVVTVPQQFAGTASVNEFVAADVEYGP